MGSLGQRERTGRGVARHGMGVLGVLALACSGETTPEPTYIPTQGGTPPGQATEVEGARTYSFTDADFDSLIYTQVFAVEGTAGHDHVMRAADYTGAITWDSNDPSACEVAITLDVDAIKVDEDAMRDLVGYGDHLSDFEKSSVRNNMLSADQLDGSGFPTMRFVSTGCSGSGDSVTLTGDLTIHGVTKSKDLTFAPTITTEGLFVSTTLSYRQSEFGVTPYKLLGYENADEVLMTLSIHGVAAE